MKTKNKRLLFYGLSRFLSRGIPFIAIVYIYGLFEQQEATTQMTGMSMLTVAIIIILFYKDIKDKTKSLVNTKWKYAMEETKLLIVFTIVFLFIQWAKSGILEIEILVFVLMICQALAIYPSALHKQLVKIEEKEKEEE